MHADRIVRKLIELGTEIIGYTHGRIQGEKIERASEKV